MRIELTPEQEKIVEDTLKAGRFRTLEEVIDQAIQALHDKYISPYRDQRRAVQEMLDFVEHNRVRLQDISIRQLIDEGRTL